MSSKRALRRRSCEGKQSYPDAAAAQKQVSWIKRGSVAATAMLIAYRCPFCSRWHVGRPAASVRQSITATRQARRAAL